jgi:hypothetical protein
MSTRSENKGQLTAIALLLLAQCFSQTAQAQTPEQLLRGILDTVTQSRNRDKPPQQFGQPSSQGVTAADMLGSAAAAPAARQPVLYPTRELLLNAARSGELAGFNRATAEDTKKVVASVRRILRVEYQVPPISQNCYENGPFVSDVTVLLGDLTAVQVISLSEQPPEFINTNTNQANYTESINRHLAKLQKPRDRTHCDEEVMGNIVPHPYKAALVSLAGDYAKATRAYVEGERARRKADYQEKVAQQQEQGRQQQEIGRQRQATAAAAEQQRIDAEAARVRQQEELRAKKEKARVGG